MSIAAKQSLSGSLGNTSLEGHLGTGTHTKVINVGIPGGGKAGQYLRKKSDNDYDVEWSDLEIPKEYGLISYNQDKTITIT